MAVCVIQPSQIEPFLKPLEGFSLAMRMGSTNKRKMAQVNIEIQGVAPFDCKGNSSALGLPFGRNVFIRFNTSLWPKEW